MLRAYKYRIYPTDEQKVKLAKTFGCCRYVYNWALELKEKEYRENKKGVSEYDMNARVRHELREAAPWLGEVSSKALEFAIEDLFNGYNNFFEKRAERPKYRRKHERQHFHTRSTSPNGISVDFKRGLLTIPKIKDIPCVFHRRFNTKECTIKQVGVELLPSGVYRVSILVNDDKLEPTKAPIDPELALGIDTGLKHFAVLSDGQDPFEPIHYAKKEKRKMKLLQRRLSKKEKGSRQLPPTEAPYRTAARKDSQPPP